MPHSNQDSNNLFYSYLWWNG